MLQQQADHAGRMSPASYSAAAKAYAGFSSPAEQNSQDAHRWPGGGFNCAQRACSCHHRLAALESPGNRTFVSRGGNGNDVRVRLQNLMLGCDSQAHLQLHYRRTEMSNESPNAQMLQSMVRRLEQDTLGTGNSAV